MSRWEDIWPEFEQKLKAKLEKGYEDHTDASFARSPEELICELQAEALDYAGWGLVFYSRMKSALGHLAELRQEFAAIEQERNNMRQQVATLKLRIAKLKEEERAA